MVDVIRYECVAQAHLNTKAPTQGGVTIHDRSWAYCRAPDADTPHPRAATGGIALESVGSI